MDKERFEQLTAGGVDVEDALSRFMGNETLLEKFLNKFCADQNYAELLKAAENRDTDGMIKASHTLKGMCGNLSMTELFELLTRQLAELRGGNMENALGLMASISEEYDKITGAIQGC